MYTEHACTIGQFELPEWTLYFIDFGSSRLLPAGPGTGVVINDYWSGAGRWDPPEGVDDLDPYTYDIFALGVTVDQLLDVRIVILKNLYSF